VPKRLTITLEDDAAELLPRLAASPRKQGEFLSRLVRSAAEQQSTPPSANPDLETLALKILQLDREITAIKAVLRELEELDTVRAYDEAVSAGETPIPFEQALAEIEQERHGL
jgi:hypothetical protein